MSDTPNVTQARITGLPEGVKACHRFMIPSTIMEEVGKGIGQQTVVRQQMGFLPCIKSDCALWNGEFEHLPKLSTGECWDVTRSRAVAKIEKHKWNEVVGSEH